MAVRGVQGTNSKISWNGVECSISKTKYTLMSVSERKMNLYNLRIEGNSFNAVNKFRYPGNMVDSEGSILM